MGAGGWTYATRIEPGWLDLVQVRLALPRLNAAFAGFRLAQVSDIHLSDALTPAQLADAFDRLMEHEPDMVVLTGDYIDKRQELISSLKSLMGVLEEYAKRVPMAAILGNHDYRLELTNLRQRMEAAGVRLLKNEVLHLERENARLHVAGLDDLWHGRPNLRAVLDDLPDDGAAILLVHEPDYAVTSARSGRFDLQLSGHTHGGQVVLPFIGPPILPHYGRKFPSGLYQVEGMYQYTNRGLGTTSPHVRFNCRPEVTIFSLYPERQGNQGAVYRVR